MLTFSISVLEGLLTHVDNDRLRLRLSTSESLHYKIRSVQMNTVPSIEVVEEPLLLH